MTPRDLFGFSAGALRGHRLRTGLSLLGVAIGVASVILLTSLGEGARIYVTGEFASLGSNLIIVIPGKIETTGGVPLMGASPRDLTLDVDLVPDIEREGPASAPLDKDVQFLIRRFIGDVEVDIFGRVRGCRVVVTACLGYRGVLDSYFLSEECTAVCQYLSKGLCLIAG